MAEKNLIELNQQVIEILTDLLQTGNWDASLFFRTAHKKLQDLLDEANTLAQEIQATALLETSDEKLGHLKVYVSIYQSDPHNLVKWQNTLRSIKEYSITRPVYRDESHIQEMIRAKQASPNEAYVTIYIKEGDLIPPYAGKKIQDKFGHELLTVRDGSLLPENIVEFVHLGKKYAFKEGKLVLKSVIS